MTKPISTILVSWMVPLSTRTYENRESSAPVGNQVLVRMTSCRVALVIAT